MLSDRKHVSCIPAAHLSRKLIGGAKIEADSCHIIRLHVIKVLQGGMQ